MLELKEDLTSPCLLWETIKRGGHSNKTAVTLSLREGVAQ